MSDELVPVKVADHLEEDPAIRGQRFACVSFVSPGDALASKDAFAARRFLSNASKEVAELLGNLVTTFEGSKAETYVKQTVQMLKERHGYLWDERAAQTEYTLWRSQQATEIDDAFRAEHGQFTTTIQGFKVRGVYDTIDDAKARAKAIQRFDAKFNVFIAEVGCWCPWSPSVEDLKDVEYAETQLNTLMKKYNEGQDARDELYQTRKDDKVAQMNKDREVWVERLKARLAAEAPGAADPAAADPAAAADPSAADPETAPETSPETDEKTSEPIAAAEAAAAAAAADDDENEKK